MNKKLIGGGIAAVVVLVIAVWFLFFRSDAPDAVDVDAANTQLDEDLAAAAEDGDEPAAPGFDGDVNGGVVREGAHALLVGRGDVVALDHVVRVRVVFERRAGRHEWLLLGASAAGFLGGEETRHFLWLFLFLVVFAPTSGV